jgi:hypothetical protein
MDFLITGFLYFVFNLFCPQKQRNLNDMENGAAYFFSTAGMEHNREYTESQEPKDGVEW